MEKFWFVLILLFCSIFIIIDCIVVLGGMFIQFLRCWQCVSLIWVLVVGDLLVVVLGKLIVVGLLFCIMFSVSVSCFLNLEIGVKVLLLFCISRIWNCMCVGCVLFGVMWKLCMQILVELVGVGNKLLKKVRFFFNCVFLVFSVFSCLVICVWVFLVIFRCVFMVLVDVESLFCLVCMVVNLVVNL